jgi:hypothetical protein
VRPREVSISQPAVQLRAELKFGPTRAEVRPYES